MKTGFKDPIAIKNQRPEDKPKDKQTSLGWDFRCPQYDQRTSCFVNAGTHYGIGHKQPVGSMTHNNKGHIPTTREVTTMETDEVG
jgi:hypothetical protein